LTKVPINRQSFLKRLLFLLVSEELFGLLLLLSLLPSLAGLLNLMSSGFGQIAQLFGSLFFGLLFVDEFHEYSLILKDIALCFQVKVVIEMSIDLLVLAILLQKPSEDSHAPNPQHFDGHPSVGRSLSFAGTRVSALTPGLSILADAGARVNGHWFADNETVFNEFADVLPRVGVRDLIGLVRV